MYSQTWAHDNLQIVTTCLPRPRFEDTIAVLIQATFVHTTSV